MADRVDVPALLRRAARQNENPNRYPWDDAAYLDRLADAVEAMNALPPRRWRESVAQASERAEAGRAVLALLRGEVAP